VSDVRNPSRRGPINKTAQPSAVVAPVVKIFLDRERTMKYDFYALSKLEEETGYSVLDEATWENMKIRDVVKFLWAGLIHEDPELSVDDVAKMIHFGNVRDVMNAISETFHQSLPSPAGQEASGEVPTSGLSQSGLTSGPQPATT
jgi:hypothetical protein